MHRHPPNSKRRGRIHDGTANHRVKRLRPKRAYATSKAFIEHDLFYALS